MTSHPIPGFLLKEPACSPLGASLLCIFVLAWSWPPGTHATDRSPSSHEILIPVTTPQGVKIFTELAETTEKRARGLMYRDGLPPDRGMLFTFPEPQQWTFWMKNTKISLDIIWMDQNKTIVHVEHDVPGCNRQDDGCPQYQPNKNALYVLEVAAGVAERLQLKRGVKLQFQVPPSALGLQPRTLP